MFDTSIPTSDMTAEQFIAMFDTSIPINPSATDFEHFMARVWSDFTDVIEDGMVVYSHPLYETWHNAREAAIRLGAVKLYPCRKYGERWWTYQFPGGSRINISIDGSQLRSVKLRGSSAA